MRTSLLIHPQGDQHETIFPRSPLTILIKIEPSSTSLLHLPKERCLPRTVLPTIHPQRASILLPLPPRSPNRRRTTGQKLQTLKREDAFRIELHRENSETRPKKPRNAKRETAMTELMPGTLITRPTPTRCLMGNFQDFHGVECQ